MVRHEWGKISKAIGDKVFRAISSKTIRISETSFMAMRRP